jgi:hypothetical protein
MKKYNRIENLLSGCARASGGLQSALLSTALIGMLVSFGAVAETQLDTLKAEISLLTVQLDQGRAPLSSAAIAPETVSQAADRASDVIATLGGIGLVDAQPSLVADADQGQLSSTTLWQQAETVYQTLLARCEYWRDHADGPSAGRVSLGVVAERIQALEIGSRQELAAAIETDEPKADNHVEAKLDEIYAFLDALNAPITAVNFSRISSTQINGVINEFYQQVSTLCPVSASTLNAGNLPSPETEEGVALSCERIASADTEDGFVTFCDFIPIP